MTTTKPTSLFVKHIDPEAHKALKVYAAQRGMTMKEAVEKAIAVLVGKK